LIHYAKSAYSAFPHGKAIKTALITSTFMTAAVNEAYTKDLILSVYKSWSIVTGNRTNPL